MSISMRDCLQWTLTYECTVTGGLEGATVWTGTALDCLSDEIVLLHQGSIYAFSRYCNNGTIMAQSLSVQDNLYTSQLSVTVTYDVAGKMIMCIYTNNGTDSNASQFSTQIPGIIRAVTHVCTLP